jgi:hypothetical protein
MAETTCPNCGCPQSEYANGQADYFCLATGDINCESRELRLVRSQLSQAQAEIAAAELVVMLARRLLALEEDQRSWSDGTWEACREELDGALVAFDAARAAVGKGTT